MRSATLIILHVVVARGKDNTTFDLIAQRMAGYTNYERENVDFEFQFQVQKDEVYGEQDDTKDSMLWSAEWLTPVIKGAKGDDEALAFFSKFKDRRLYKHHSENAIGRPFSAGRRSALDAIVFAVASKSSNGSNRAYEVGDCSGRLSQNARINDEEPTVLILHALDVTHKLVSAR